MTVTSKKLQDTREVMAEAVFNLFPNGAWFSLFRDGGDVKVEVTSRKYSPLILDGASIIATREDVVENVYATTNVVDDDGEPIRGDWLGVVRQRGIVFDAKPGIYHYCGMSPTPSGEPLDYAPLGNGRGIHLTSGGEIIVAPDWTVW